MPFLNGTGVTLLTGGVSSGRSATWAWAVSFLVRALSLSLSLGEGGRLDAKPFNSVEASRPPPGSIQGNDRRGQH